jgi:hypothetical protein
VHHFGHLPRIVKCMVSIVWCNGPHDKASQTFFFCQRFPPTTRVGDISGPTRSLDLKPNSSLQSTCAPPLHPGTESEWQKLKAPCSIKLYDLQQCIECHASCLKQLKKKVQILNRNPYSRSWASNLFLWRRATSVILRWFAGRKRKKIKWFIYNRLNYVQFLQHKHDL